MPILLVLLLLLCPPAWGASELSLTPNKVTTDQFFEIIGYNKTDKPQIVVTRITDRPNAAYHDRVNEERWVLPGSFKILIQPAALQTPGGRFLQLDKMLHMLVFSPAPLTFSSIKPAKYRKAHPLAFDFGPTGAPVFPGFTPIDPTSPTLTSGRPKPFIRKGADSLIRDGIKGVTRFETPLPNGQWMVHLWSEDIGEWETLPPLYERRIRINGRDVAMVRQTHQDWISNRYMKGQNDSGPTPWDHFGGRRGDLIQRLITVHNNSFKLELAGSNAQATSLTGLILEPIDSAFFAQTQALRKNWFQQRWPFVVDPAPLQEPTPTSLIAFAGETIFIRAPKGLRPQSPVIRIKKFGARRAFHRTAPNSGLLIKTARRFRPTKSWEDTTHLRLTLPHSLTPGRYDLNGIQINVVGARLPRLNQAIGVYLEDAAHLKDRDAINQQVWCDLDRLKQLGLTAIAPPFSADIVADYQRARAFGFQEVLAYTPMKRHHDAVRTALASGHINDLIFSIADEPSNPAQAQNIPALSQFLQNESRTAKRAGHLNNPRDKKHLDHLDVVLINSGFGVDLHHIRSLQRQNKSAWFYNMEDTQLAAGFYMWRTGADGFLQWHARMPTADPFDPTDGREGDVQMLYPTKTLCSQYVEIDKDLISMVNGLSDLRWLTWLDEMATRNSTAYLLRKKIYRATPNNWKAARSRPSSHWRTLKHEIQKLALSLQHHP